MPRGRTPIQARSSRGHDSGANRRSAAHDPRERNVTRAGRQVQRLATVERLGKADVTRRGARRDRHAAGGQAHRVAPAGGGRVGAGEGWTDLFITPGFAIRGVGALLTNFHLPRSSLLLLVSAFTSRERILAAYAEAVRRRYRFYSYGDASLIL